MLTASTLSLAACTSVGDTAQTAVDRDLAVQELQRQAGAPIALEVGDAGDVRVLATTPRFAIPGHATDPAAVAMDFVATHHDVFQLDADAAREFVVARVDGDRAGDVRHVTLQREYNGIPVFQGAISVHMDPGNGVFRVLGDDSYHIAAPSNRTMLDPAEAVVAAGRALGVTLVPSLVESTGQRQVFDASAALDPIDVDQKIVHVAEGDDRFAYQVTVSWLDDSRQQQYQLVLIDAADGSLLANYSLVDTFKGRVFNRSPGANPTTDARVVMSFDGDPTASPAGWVGTARKTAGNNAVTATDLNGNNKVDRKEIQPAANDSGSFDFPFSPAQSPSASRAAAVTTAFFLVNDFHDRTYALGFTESAGNFQAKNFGRGGLQNDPVNTDVQDGAGTNNANFATPPDGRSPRMQMFLFTVTGGDVEDGGFDATVIYHEYAHGLSNRLVGGGTTTCLRGLQSGGMGEGWGDFMSATFLNDPVVGAYVTGDAVRGIRAFSMARSPLTYGDIRSGRLAEVHDVGELWAAALWDLRKRVGAATVEQLVVSGMKLTPCNPTMLNARDAILQADATINHGANECAIWAAFAGREMGTGASSATHNSTTTITTSRAVPASCR
jgi:hypothetical protein